MSKEIYISSTPHETRLAIVEQDQLSEIYYERENEYTLAGSIYKGRVTRVLPGMQSSFVDVGLERDAFLYVTDFMEEVGESADFESADGGAGRKGRGESSRGGAENRGSEQRSPDRRNAEQRSAESRTQEPGGSEPRSQESRDGSSRNGEGRRHDGRGRGGRGRGGQENRGDSQTGQVASSQPTEPTQSAPINMAPGGNDADEMGEGAPGADGTRRWRGRRGRRRGRGNVGQRPEGSIENTSADGSREDSSQNSFVESASPIGAPSDIFAEDFAQEQSEAPASSSGRSHREERHADAPRTERSASSQEAAAPFLLPGESLSKYRRGEDASPSQGAGANAQAQHTPLAQPSTVFELGSSWDGGSQLPGETLSRHRSNSLPTSKAASQTVAAEKQLEPFFPTPVPEPEPQEVKSVEVAQQAEPNADLATEAAAPTEYEPREAAASYKVDPSAPSEYRQTFVEEEAEAPIAESPIPGQPAQPFATLAEEPQQIIEIEEEDSFAEIAEDEAPRGGVAAEEPEEVAQLQSEALSFAASGGVVEEEIIDGEEYDYEPIEAGAEDHEMDDLEEETIDGAADIGTMVRDMHLEERTRSNEPDPLDEEFDAASEEEDFEEASFAEPDTDIEEDADEDALDGGEGQTSDATETTGDAIAAPSSERRGRREGGRDGRRGSRDGRRSGGDRGGDRRRGGPGGGGRGRQSMQMSALPIISDLLKPGQEILVQIAKEPMAKKGARITSHIALPGRFLVFMPTVNHVGVSRKIESDEERHRLKRILLSEKGEASGGFIVRTAADGASEDELRSDLRFLINLWNDIKTRSDSSKAPALIYHDLNLVERILRDQVTDTFSAIWVDTEAEYERVLRFLQRFQPSLIRRVKLYTKETPLFEQFGITAEIDTALKSKVWLKSGGSIVINQTEALVAIDINTGKYVGKTARLEDTIVKTNLDAIPEIVRQIRLRDLGGIIVIDFIDMDDRKNRNKVMAALEDELKNDRAPSKVLHFNDFGLVAITRKRVKQSLERTLSVPCAICTGTGMTKSPVTVCNEIYIEMRKMHKHLERADIMLRVHPEVVKQLKSNSGRWLVEMEEMARKTILVKSDPSLHPEQYDIH